jgi:hypothetical protein
MSASAAAEFLLARARVTHRHRCLQARRVPPLTSSREGEALCTFAERHVAGVRDVEARALAAWSLRPSMAVVVSGEMTPSEIVSLQARGQRCVSLNEVAAPEDGLAYALHDLRHLGKFFQPELHLEQRGFFACVERALRSEAWQALDARLDARWLSDRDAVLADMNGSAVFLFSALKMRLRMAARRRHARVHDEPAPTSGGLSASEEAEAAPLLELCLDGLELTGDVRQAARAISCRRDAELHAARFVEAFRGEAA